MPCGCPSHAGRRCGAAAALLGSQLLRALLVGMHPVPLKSALHQVRYAALLNPVDNLLPAQHLWHALL